MAKVNVSLPDGLLEQVDELAAEMDRSRSGLVQEATAQYVTRLIEDRAAAERQASIARAIAGMRELSKTVGSFDSTAVIRADRDSDYGNADV